MKIKKLKEYECGQNDDDDDSVVMVFVAVSRARNCRRFAIGLNMLCCRAQCFLTLCYRIEQSLFSYLFSPIHCRPKREIKIAG